MLQILLHSSKSMTDRSEEHKPLGTPIFKNESQKLATIWLQTSQGNIAKLMRVSNVKAAQVKDMYTAWSLDPALQSPAIDAFRGDIYSGLQVGAWSKADRKYAHKHLVILSGLYGALRACDGIMPYRLEMGYKLPGGDNMYTFWGKELARIIQPEATCLINLSAVEYTKAILPHVDDKVIAPKFMTISPATGEPAFVTVHAKIARGAFARWLIQARIENPRDIYKFNDLGYNYHSKTSTPQQPVFVCQSFQGLGLSVRL